MDKQRSDTDKSIEIKHVAALGDQKYPSFELRAIISYLNNLGHQTWCSNLLETLELTDRDLETPFLCAHKALKALELVLEAFDELGLGCHIAKTYRLNEFGTIGRCIKHSKTLGDALALTHNYYNLIGSFTDITNIIDEQRLTNRLVNVSDLPQNIQRFLFELTVAGLIAIGEELSGQRIPVRVIRFSQTLNDDQKALYQSLFQCPIEDASKFDEWDLDIKFATIPVSLPKASIEDMIQDLNTLDHEWSQGKGLVDDIDDILQGSPGDYPDPDMLAHAMGVSARTLRRKLNNVGTSYSALINKVRCQLVIDLITHHNLSNEGLAQALGFSDAANFHHAFKKWTGNTPNYYRLKRV